MRVRARACVRACVRACENTCARARAGLGSCAYVGVRGCSCPYQFSDVRLACQPHYPDKALSTQRASATLQPQFHRTCRAQAAVAAIHEDGIRWTLHTYEADVGSGLAAVSGAATPRSLISKIRAVSQNCGGSGAAKISLTLLTIFSLQFQIIEEIMMMRFHFAPCICNLLVSVLV